MLYLGTVNEATICNFSIKEFN